MIFFSELRRRNPPLYWFGLFNIAVGIICILLQFADNEQLLGINRWVKPMKFYLSVGIMALSMGWLMYYLDNRRKIKWYSAVIIVTMFFENGLIIMQAIRHTTSHFNVLHGGFDAGVFSLMGILITIFIIVCVLIAISFFRQKQFTISVAYLWGIRLGLVLFIFFSLEGGVMVGLLKHTIGAADGGNGLPLVNWSRQYGDLRIAHFAGIHALQLLPLLGYYVAKTKKQMLWITAIYFILVMALFYQAMQGIPLFFK